MSQAPFVSLAQIPDFSPHDVEVLGTDAHLPAVPLHALSEASLRQRFARPDSGKATAFHEPLWNDVAPKPASVLLGLVMRAQPSVLLTVRTAHLSSHSGQVALPGGRQDTQDADEIATALREAQEEVGLAPEFVEVLGTLPTYVTGSSFIITPVVALVQCARTHLGVDLQSWPVAYDESRDTPADRVPEPWWFKVLDSALTVTSDVVASDLRQPAEVAAEPDSRRC